MLIPTLKASKPAFCVARSIATRCCASQTTTAMSMSMLDSVVTSSLPVALSLCGGATKTAAIDMGRTRLRLEGLHTYGVIASLLMNSALRLFSATPKRTTPATNKREFFENAVKFVFTISMMFSVFAGAYTTIVLSLLGLYSKRALGRGHDAQFLEFFAATEDIRRNSYSCLAVALATFEMSFVLSLFLNYRGRMRWVILPVAIALAVLCGKTWLNIMNLAITIIPI